jgi:RimJ/RimL family protein N-acetyltransferase
MVSQSFLENQNIYLRPLVDEDLPRWTSWFNSSKTTLYMNKGYFPTLEDGQLKRLESLNFDKNNIQLAIVTKEDDELIGIIGMHKIDWVHRHADISIVIGNINQIGKGYGSQAIEIIVRHAFLKLNLRKLTSGMWANNKASEKIFLANGFIMEGQKRQQFFFQNEYVGELNYGLLKDDWEKS